VEPHKHRAESPFWRFSLRFYARPKVAEACLTLQDSAQADINLLLFLLFLADHRRGVSAQDIARLDQAVSQWRDTVVKPLRALRRGLKQGIEFIPGPVSETFRAQIKRLELESEQIEQHRLEEFAAEGVGSLAETRTQAAENNLSLYCAILQQPRPDAVAAILRGFAEFVPIGPPAP
jgi:uncharacterized protein (TIGR02444 family)